MGCWNGSCVLSGLPIMEGDPAVAIPIVIHGGDSIIPTFFPLFGEYNDYGSLTKVKSTAMSRKLVGLVKDSLTTDVDKKPDPTFNKARLLKLIEMGEKTLQADESLMEEYSNLMLEQYKGERSACDSPLLLQGSQWKYALGDGKNIENEEDLLKVLEREQIRGDTLQWVTPKSKKSLSMLLVHGRVWDALNGLLKENAESYLTKRVIKNPERKLERTERAELSEHAVKILRGHLERQILQEIQSMGSGFDVSHEWLFGEKLWSSLIGSISNGETLDEDSGVQELLNIYLFILMCHSLRRTLSPVAGAGSQAQDYSALSVVSRIVLDIAKENSEEDC